MAQLTDNSDTRRLRTLRQLARSGRVIITFDKANYVIGTDGNPKHKSSLAMFDKVDMPWIVIGMALLAFSMPFLMLLPLLSDVTGFHWIGWVYDHMPHVHFKLVASFVLTIFGVLLILLSHKSESKGRRAGGSGYG